MCVVVITIIIHILIVSVIVIAIVIITGVVVIVIHGLLYTLINGHHIIVDNLKIKENEMSCIKNC